MSNEPHPQSVATLVDTDGDLMAICLAPDGTVES